MAPAPVTASPMVGPVESRDREVSSTFLPRPQRSPSGQSRSVGSECRRLEESRVFTAAHLCSWDSLILGLLGTGTCGEVKPGDVSRERECEKINRRQPRRTYLV